MKRMMSVAMIALFMTGAAAFACDSCGCSAKKAEKKAECTSCSKDKGAEKSCAASCTKACCAKADAAKK